MFWCFCPDIRGFERYRIGVPAADLALEQFFFLLHMGDHVSVFACA
jgi:hypothetical protein